MYVCVHTHVNTTTWSLGVQVKAVGGVLFFGQLNDLMRRSPWGMPNPFPEVDRGVYVVDGGGNGCSLGTEQRVLSVGQGEQACD